MNDRRPAPPGQAQDAAHPAATLEWPPTADDLNAIACVDLRATRAVVCPPPELTLHPPPPRAVPPRPAVRLDDDLALRWPPPQADVDGITAWSLADGALRPPAPRLARVGRSSRIAATVAAAAATFGFAIAQWPAPEIRRAPANVAPVAGSPSGARPAAAAEARGVRLREAPVQRQAAPVTGTPAAGPTLAAVAAPAVVDVGPLPPTPRMVPAAATAPPLRLVGTAKTETPREAGDVIEDGPTDARPSDALPAVVEPTLVVSTELSGRLPTAAPPPLLAPPPAARRAAPATAGLADMATAPARDLEAPRIQAVLSRYGAAYSRLDAGAAREVWPTVDARALSRAFDALRSQEVVLDQCDIAVNGNRAEAACRGTSTFVPRVGDPSPRRESRRWRFELARTDGAAWHIRSAESH